MPNQNTRRFPFAVGNMVLALMFFLAGFTGIFGGQHLESAAWFSLTAGALLLGSESTPWNRLPLWRRALGGLTVAAGVALILYRLALTLGS